MSRSFRPGFALLLLLPASAGAASYQAAKDDYDQGHVAAARAGFQAVVADAAATPADRAKAGRGLARIDWLVEGDRAAAERDLNGAARTGAEACETRQLLVRIRREGGRPREALKAARDLRGCATAGARDQLIEEGALAALDLAVRAKGRERRARLGAAASLVARLSPLSRLRPSANALRLELALVRRDAAGAFAAWRDYFWLKDAEAPPALDGPGSERAFFRAGLARGAGLRAAGPLLDLLARGGFARPIETFVATGGMPLAGRSDPLLRKTEAYLEFRKGLESIALATYRRLARIGDSKDPRTQAEAQRLGDDLTRLYGETAARLRPFVHGDPTFGPPAFVSATFNLGSSFGFTGGFPSVHLGHIVSDEKRTVTQYGRSAGLRFTIWDNLLSNGFQSWLWDGEMATGGFSGTGSITQMRPRYVESAIDDAALAFDPTRRRQAETKAAALAATDLDRARRADAAGHPATYLPALVLRLKLKALDQLRESQPATAADVQRRMLDFARRDFEESVAHSIWIHEGRHALDKASGATFTPAELEYRAKLAEILLGRFPRMAFASIDNALVGDGSSHGEANARILEAYAAWIGRHSAEIAGFDPRRPALTQLDRLSDAQLRAAAAELADFDTRA